MPFFGRPIRFVGPFGGLPFVGREFLRRRGDPFFFFIIGIVI